MLFPTAHKIDVRRLVGVTHILLLLKSRGYNAKDNGRKNSEKEGYIQLFVIVVSKFSYMLFDQKNYF